MTETQIRKLSDRELLIKTYGKVERIEATQDIYTKKVNNLEEKQDNFVTKKTLRIISGMIFGILTLMIAAKAAGAW